ncbi:MAG TPA: hypothetical protein VJV78_41235 [Polyangiales bacterium]|nr:hypothetical protein [Polyangiales bacterium]
MDSLRLDSPPETSAQAETVAVRSLENVWLWSCLAIGSLLRVIWPLDIEWKLDEKWMFQKAVNIAHGVEPWPLLGMQNGIGTENPGAAVWMFAALAHLADTPVGMTQLVCVSNVIAIWGFAAWVMKTWPEADRRLGLGGVALFAVSPIPVLFSRKIWAQDVLPLLLVPVLFGHSLRHRPWAAFMWGVMSAFNAQIHLSGFFATGALMLATFIFDRARTRWLPMILGGVVGCIPMLPWVAYLFTPEASRNPRPVRWSLIYFWDAFKTAFGLDLRYPLRKEFSQFLRGPSIAGVDTWLIAAAHIALLLLALASAVVVVRSFRKITLSQHLKIYATTLLFTGLMFHALRVRLFVHYLIILSPLLHIGAAWMLSQRRHWLAACCALQLFLSASFLWYIHANGGAPRGDFGITYRAQTPEQRTSDMNGPPK